MPDCCECYFGVNAVFSLCVSAFRCDWHKCNAGANEVNAANLYSSGSISLFNSKRNGKSVATCGNYTPEFLHIQFQLGTKGGRGK